MMGKALILALAVAAPNPATDARFADAVGCVGLSGRLRDQATASSVSPRDPVLARLVRIHDLAADAAHAWIDANALTRTQVAGVRRPVEARLTERQSRDPTFEAREIDRCAALFDH